MGKIQESTIRLPERPFLGIWGDSRYYHGDNLHNSLSRVHLVGDMVTKYSFEHLLNVEFEVPEIKKPPTPS